MTRTDDSIIIEISSILLASLLRAEDEFGRRTIEFLLFLDDCDHLGKRRRVADHDTTNEMLSIGGEDEFEVGRGEGVEISE